MQHVSLDSIVGANGQVSGSKTYTFDTEIVQDIAVAGASTNLHVDIDIDVSAIKSIIVSSTRDMTIKTNSSGSPAETIALKGGVPYKWNTDSYHTNLFATDITALYLTLASGAADTLKIRCGLDGTP